MLMTLSITQCLASIATVFLLAGCSQSGPTTTISTAAFQPMPAEQENGSYVIGPGDQLQVFVYDSPQLSTEVPVRPDGRISTPLVPELMAAGKTPSQLANDLTA